MINLEIRVRAPFQKDKNRCKTVKKSDKWPIRGEIDFFFFRSFRHFDPLTQDEEPFKSKLSFLGVDLDTSVTVKRNDSALMSRAFFYLNWIRPQCTFSLPKNPEKCRKTQENLKLLLKNCHKYESYYIIVLPFERNRRLHQFLVHLHLAPTVILIYPAASVSSPFSQVRFLSVLDFLSKFFFYFQKISENLFSKNKTAPIEITARQSPQSQEMS